MSRSKEIIEMDRVSRFNQGRVRPRDENGSRVGFVLGRMPDVETGVMKLVSVPCKIDDRGKRLFGRLNNEQLRALGKNMKGEE